MLIISKYKDYYDWLVSKWGIDTKVVYNRTRRYNGYGPFYFRRDHTTPETNYRFYVLEVGYTKYFYVGKNTKSMGDYMEYKLVNKIVDRSWRLNKNNTPISLYSVYLNEVYGFESIHLFMEGVRKVNLESDEFHTKRMRPWSSMDRYLLIEDPIIKDTPLPLPDAEEVFLSTQDYISSLIGDGKDCSTPNDIKIIQYGFDVKRSFRHR